jgi:hypothetical protein
MTSRLRAFTAIAAAVLVTVGWHPGPTDAATTAVKFGARAGKTVSAYESYESRVGDKVSNARLYYLWDQPFPDATATWARDGGRQVFMSVRAKRLNGTLVPWSNLAAAQPGSALYAEMRAWATQIKNFQAPVYFTFNHEPETKVSSGNGTAEDYVLAWRNFITILRDEGVTNAEYVFIGTAYGFGRGRAQPYYPGDAYVDAIGADAYNWYTCRPGITNAWFSMKNLVDRMMPFAEKHPNEQLMLPEFGTTEDPSDPTRKPLWYAQAQQLFKEPPYDRFVLINEYDTLKGCQFRPDSSAASLAAFKDWLADPYYSG